MSVVSYDVETTALVGTLRPERRYDDMTTDFHRPCYLSHIRRAVRRIGQEVKNRPVVPNVELMRLKRIRRHVCLKPFHSARIFSQSFFRNLNSDLRHVEHGKVAVTAS